MHPWPRGWTYYACTYRMTWVGAAGRVVGLHGHSSRLAVLSSVSTLLGGVAGGPLDRLTALVLLALRQHSGLDLNDVSIMAKRTYGGGRSFMAGPTIYLSNSSDGEVPSRENYESEPDISDDSHSALSWVQAPAIYT